jgi:hypothetical protein
MSVSLPLLLPPWRQVLQVCGIEVVNSGGMPTPDSIFIRLDPGENCVLLPGHPGLLQVPAST